MHEVISPDDATTTGTLTLANPTPAISLAFASASGYNAGGINVVVHFADGTADVSGSFQSPDWYGQGQAIVATHNRVYVANGTFDYVFPLHPTQIQGPVIFE